MKRDWEITKVEKSPRTLGVYVTGINHCADGEPLHWHLGWKSFRHGQDRFDYSGAEFTEGGREMFDWCVARAAKA
jgi:hypothetical protein